MCWPNSANGCADSPPASSGSRAGRAPAAADAHPAGVTFPARAWDAIRRRTAAKHRPHRFASKPAPSSRQRTNLIGSRTASTTCLAGDGPGDTWQILYEFTTQTRLQIDLKVASRPTHPASKFVTGRPTAAVITDDARWNLSGRDSPHLPRAGGTEKIRLADAAAVAYTLSERFGINVADIGERGAPSRRASTSYWPRQPSRCAVRFLRCRRWPGKRYPNKRTPVVSK